MLHVGSCWLPGRDLIRGILRTTVLVEHFLRTSASLVLTCDYFMISQKKCLSFNKVAPCNLITNRVLWERKVQPALFFIEFCQLFPQLSRELLDLSTFLCCQASFLKSQELQQSFNHMLLAKLLKTGGFWRYDRYAIFGYEQRSITLTIWCDIDSEISKYTTKLPLAR